MIFISFGHNIQSILKGMFHRLLKVDPKPLPAFTKESFFFDVTRRYVLDVGVSLKSPAKTTGIVDLVSHFII